jgi:hypothetical protein
LQKLTNLYLILPSGNLSYIKGNWRFGVHPLRSGGATAAANLDIPDRLFKAHGRWRSELAKDGYVEDNIEKVLSVSKFFWFMIISLLNVH